MISSSLFTVFHKRDLIGVKPIGEHCAKTDPSFGVLQRIRKVSVDSAFQSRRAVRDEEIES